MHLELTSSKWVHGSYMLEVILKSNPAICYGVLCVKRLVTPYVPLSELFYSCMNIVENPQHNINITKLQKIVRLMILLTTICTIVRICMH